MPQFRIALGYRTAHRGSEPEIIAASFSPVAIQAAIDQTGPEFPRIEVGAFQYIRKGRRKFAPVPQAPVPQAPEQESAPSDPSEESDPSDDQEGPTLAPSRRRR